MNHIEEEGPWKNLTKDVLSLILKRLNTALDLCRFRSICKSWRSFATPINPNLIFPLTLPPINPNCCSFSLSPNVLYILSPYNPPNPSNNNGVWLTKVSETGLNKWALLNPLTKHKLYFLPSGFFRNGINLLGFRNQEVGRSYRLQMINDFEGGGGNTFDFEAFSSSLSLRKVVLLNLISGKVCFSVLGLYGYSKIAIWNSGDENWKIIETGENKKKNDFDDVISFNGRFYAIDSKRRLVMIDSKSLKLVEVVNSSEECSINGHYVYLIESNFRLYMVDKIVNPRPSNYYDKDEEEWVVDKRSVGKPIGFEVFVLNEKERCWESVKELGNKVFFVSRDSTFAVGAEDLGWSKGNCVYFEGLTGYDDEADMNLGLNAGVYSLEDDSVTIFGSSVDCWTRIFWPPLDWFVQNQEYSECEMQN